MYLRNVIDFFFFLRKITDFLFFWFALQCLSVIAFHGSSGHGISRDEFKEGGCDETKLTGPAGGITVRPCLQVCWTELLSVPVTRVLDWIAVSPCYRCVGLNWVVWTLVACDSERVTWLLTARVSNIHRKGVVSYSAVWLLHGWCHVKLLPSRRTICVHQTTMHQFTVSLHVRPHT